MPFEQWCEARTRCQTDGYFLAKDVFKKGLYTKPHQPITDFFVQKKPLDLPEGYTLDELHAAIDKLCACKDSMLFYPRSSYKSTLNIIDAVQWIICVPDIRILVLTGEFKLAKAFVRELKQYFTVRDENPTLFQKLFPEFCIVSGTQDDDTKFACPMRVIDQKEPTVMANSIAANLSGWHFDLIKCDDVVTDENSRTQDARISLQTKFDTDREMLDTWGYLDIVGTRYSMDDLYGETIKRQSEENPIRILCSASMTPLKGFETIPLRELTEDQVDLLFPEKLSFKVLRTKLLKNETVFRCQQLNQPVAVSSVTFDIDELRANMIQALAVPSGGAVYVLVDWAPSGNSDGDCCAAVRITADGKAFVLEIIKGRWKPTEKAFQIVNFIRKWSPLCTCIEKSNGAELLEMALTEAAMRYGVDITGIYWQTPSNEPNAKANRVRGLQTLLATDRLKFVMGPWIDETFEQFTRYTGERKNRGRKDDIPDCLSYLQIFLPQQDAANAGINPLNAIELRAVYEESARRQWFKNMMEGGWPSQQPQEPIFFEAQEPVDERINGWLHRVDDRFDREI